MKYNVF